MGFEFATHYDWMLDEIQERLDALPAAGGRTVVLLGDSLSEANPATELAGLPVFNMGISGDEIYHPDGGLMRRLELVPQAQPRHVVVLIGVNDLNNSGKSVETIAPHYDELFQALRNAVPDSRFHLLSLLPTREPYARLMPAIGALNTILEERASELGATFVDVRPALQVEGGELRPEFTYDGLHLSDKGYEALNEALDAHLRQL